MDMRELISQMQTGMPSQGPAPAHDAVAQAGATAQAVGKAPKKRKKNPIAALAKAHKAAKAGKHAEAKSHALAAVNALHKQASAPTLP